MILASANKKRSSAEKVAERASRQFELINFIGIAAMKVRAGMMDPGKVIRLESFEFVVDEDELGEWVVVNITRPKTEIEEMGIRLAVELGIDIEFKSSGERSDWLREFVKGLKEYLEKWYEIECFQGPGEDVVFEKAAYRRASRDWR